jgi:hypothetical protein
MPWWWPDKVETCRQGIYIYIIKNNCAFLGRMITILQNIGTDVSYIIISVVYIDFYLPCWQDPQLSDSLWMQRENKEQSQVSGFCFSKKYNASGKGSKKCSEDSRIRRVRACASVDTFMFYIPTQQKTKCVMCDGCQTSCSAFWATRLIVSCEDLSGRSTQSVCPSWYASMELTVMTEKYKFKFFSRNKYWCYNIYKQYLHIMHVCLQSISIPVFTCCSGLLEL